MNNIPDLTFPAISYGCQETPWDLRPLLFRGGAGTAVKAVRDLIAKGELGFPIADRLPLVERLHAEIQSCNSRATAYDRLYVLRTFYAWCDEGGRSPTLESVVRDYIDWTEHLLFRSRIKGDLSKKSAYQIATSLSRVIGNALELPYGLLEKTRLSNPRRKKTVLGDQADKQKLQDIFAFGRALLDIVSALTVTAIQGAPPVRIPFRSGQTIDHWYGINSPDKLKSLSAEVAPSRRQLTAHNRAKWIADVSHRTRHSVINLRVDAEALIFISQTGMNVAQIKTLRAGKFRYESYLGGYRVYRVYKGRRGGEVEFEIFSEYRPIFEDYLAWREVMFPGRKNGLMFLRANSPGKFRSPHANYYWEGIQKICRTLNVPFVCARVLRKARINWLLRRSRDPDLTAEMAQHTQQTLLRIYEEPHHQVAAIEISRYHSSSDPTIVMPGPGVCSKAVPKAIPNIPPEAPAPDCASPSGCLFCIHQRDLDCEDHVWSLTTFRHLKSLELVRYRPPAGTNNLPHPAKIVIDRITAKLRHWKESSKVRALWVDEALARIDEGDYHPKWDGFVALMEARA